MREARKHFLLWTGQISAKFVGLAVGSNREEVSPTLCPPRKEKQLVQMMQQTDSCAKSACFQIAARTPKKLVDSEAGYIIRF